MRYIFWPMNKSRRVVVACLTILGIISLGMVLSGCSDNGLVINNDSSDDFVSFFDQPYYPDAVAKRADIVDASFGYVESKLAAASGGVIALNENEDVEAFVVLPGSFVADTTFTVMVTKLVTDDGETPMIYDFGPDGLVFSKPAILRLNLGVLFGKNVKAIDLFLLNKQTNEWEYVLSSDADDSQIAYVPVEHFSTYSTKSKASADPGVDQK